MSLPGRSPSEGWRVALVGNPNVGKSTLFNALTGGSQPTGNYPGVTVSWHLGAWALPAGAVDLIDLPGSYSLAAHSPDEALVQDLLQGRQDSARPDAILAIIDASNPERNLYFLSQVLDLGLPTVVALNMADVAKAKGLKVDAVALSQALGLPVIEVQANKRLGLEALAAAMGACLQERRAAKGPGLPVDGPGAADPATIRGRYTWARQSLVEALSRESAQPRFSDRLDRLLTHRVWGLVAVALILGAVFQSIYAWSAPVMEAMEGLVGWLGQHLLAPLGPGLLKDLLADGVVAGVGGVLVFVPQIAVLFFFIAILEDCGYMARSAFLMDRLFSKFGLSGRSFIPLLSSFACAVPGILSTRTIADKKERLTTILVAPLMSCSARLPVYTVMIAAFVPARRVLGVDLRGLTLLGFYTLGLLVAVPVALLLRKRLQAGAAPLFLIELPSYKWPDPRVVAKRVWGQCREFLFTAGTLILAVNILVWALGAFPRNAPLREDYEQRRAVLEAQPGAASQDAQAELDKEEAGALLRQSFLGRMGRAVEPVFAPLGWDWKISMAALASFPAREVVIGTLGTIFNVGADEEAGSASLSKTLQEAKRDDGRPVFDLAVALSLMVFFALCAQCAATLAVIKRETGHWGWAAFTFVYMTALAWLGGALTYHAALALGWGA